MLSKVSIASRHKQRNIHFSWFHELPQMGRGARRLARQRYENLDQRTNIKSMADMRRWMKERRQKVKDLTDHIPHAENKQLSYIQSNRSEQAITWIGHSTFLVQIGGLNILTDPVWAKWMGVQRRLTEPGL